VVERLTDAREFVGEPLDLGRSAHRAPAPSERLEVATHRGHPDSPNVRTARLERMGRALQGCGIVRVDGHAQGRKVGGSILDKLRDDVKEEGVVCLAPEVFQGGKGRSVQGRRQFLRL